MNALVITEKPPIGAFIPVKPVFSTAEIHQRAKQAKERIADAGKPEKAEIRDQPPSIQQIIMARLETDRVLPLPRNRGGKRKETKIVYRIKYLKPIGPGLVFLYKRPDFAGKTYNNEEMEFVPADCYREVIAHANRLPPKIIKEETRVRSVVAARMELAYTLKLFKDMSFAELAKACGMKDHTTALHAVRKFCDKNKLPLPEGMRLPIHDPKRRYSPQFVRGDYQNA